MHKTEELVVCETMPEQLPLRMKVRQGFFAEAFESKRNRGLSGPCHCHAWRKRNGSPGTWRASHSKRRRDYTRLFMQLKFHIVPQIKLHLKKVQQDYLCSLPPTLLPDRRFSILSRILSGLALTAHSSVWPNDFLPG